MEAGESDEFRHFLSGVDLIFKHSARDEALEFKPVLSVGERFIPLFTKQSSLKQLTSMNRIR